MYRILQKIGEKLFYNGEKKFEEPPKFLRYPNNCVKNKFWIYGNRELLKETFNICVEAIDVSKMNKSEFDYYIDSL